MKLMWLGYLIYSLGNCTMKLCIETGLITSLYSTPLQDQALGSHWSTYITSLQLEPRAQGCWLFYLVMKRGNLAILFGVTVIWKLTCLEACLFSTPSILNYKSLSSLQQKICIVGALHSTHLYYQTIVILRVSKTDCYQQKQMERFYYLHYSSTKNYKTSNIQL